jgi:hypothetical protein
MDEKPKKSSGVDIGVLSTINAPVADPVRADELVGWLTGKNPVDPGRGSLAIFSFFTEVPSETQFRFLRKHNIEDDAAKRIADQWVWPFVAKREHRGRSR